MTFSQAGLAYDIPASARRVLAVLEGAGYEAWVVGGWVRDALRGAPSHDVDICCSAHWEESARLLRAADIAVHETGTAHGTITAVVDGEPIEVTTFREEGTYSDHRHPDGVRFVADATADLGRRDFTVNAIAYHPERGLLDPYGGKEDLTAGVIRAVGEPCARFSEDALRVLRAVRFAARLGFVIEPATQAALGAAAPDLAYVAQERIGQELTGIVASGRVGWALMEETEVMVAALPELAPSVGFDQRSIYHAYDVLEHTAHVCRAVEAFTAGMATLELRWAALLHDIGKPATFTLDAQGRGHFFGHPGESARQAQALLRRLAIPKDQAARIVSLVRYHDRLMWPEPRSVRKMLYRLERECPGQAYSLIHQLFNLKRGDAISKVARVANYAVDIDAMERIAREETRAHVPLTVRELAIDGNDVMAEGVSAGPDVGLALDLALEAVLDGTVPNERAALLSYLHW